MITLGIDTSNYATSMALFDSSSNSVICSFKKFLPVKSGSCGLRQSDAVFHHTVALQELLQNVNEVKPISIVEAVCVSNKPRPIEGSYMPCFLTGVTLAKAIATSLNVPLFYKSHQEGHLSSAIHALNNNDLYNEKLLFFHISGGTTELLLCDGLKIEKCIGGSNDLYAGQAVDRLGVKLGFDFPSGVMVSKLAEKCDEDMPVSVSVSGLNCNLSGLQNKCEQLLASGKSDEYVCKYCLKSIAVTIIKMIENARKIYPNYKAICAGGVMSSTIIKQYVQKNAKDTFFVSGEYSSDNAMGTAKMAYLSYGEK